MAKTTTNFAFKMLTTLLLIGYGLENTNAISQYKPQQTTSQPKSHRKQQSIEQQQQPQPLPQQQQMQMQQAMPTMQHESEGQELSSAVEGKDNNAQDISQDSDYFNPFKMINEIKRENNAQSSSHPIHHHSMSQMPSTQLPSSPSSWNVNPFLNHGSSPTGFPSAQPPYPMSPYYGMSQFFAAPYASTPHFGTPKYLPFMAFNQPMFLPFTPFIPPEFFYSPFPGAVGSDFEDTSSRSASSRRPTTLTNGRDSPIFYMRIPPTPYMFLPNFGNSPSYGSNFAPISPFQNSIAPYPGLSQTYNLPLNFIANGKPSGIHSFLPDIHNFASIPHYPRPPTPHFPGNYFPSYNSIPLPLPSPSTPPPPPPPYQDSKLTSLKQPFFFNGRPEDIYVLQNSFNSLFPGL